MKKRTVFTVTLFGVLLTGLILGGCDIGGDGGDDDPETSGIRVNIRVVAEAVADLAGLEIITDALEARGVTATLLLSPEFVQAHCEQVRALREAGFEIMAYASALEIDGEIVTLSLLSEQEQTEYLQAIRDAFDDCLDMAVKGFGGAGYDQNEVTWDILEKQGYAYNLGLLSHSLLNLPGFEGAFWPYQSEDYTFWAVPMQTVYANRQWTPLCDASFYDQLDAAGWENLLKDQLGLMDNLGRPFMIEVHARFTGADEQWLNALLNIIADGRQKKAVFASVDEMIAWVKLRVEEIQCLPCLQ